MRVTFANAVRVMIACAILAPAVVGSSLKLDGQDVVDKFMGTPVTLTVTGTPGKAVTLVADVLPGPTLAFGQSLPISFTPFATFISIGTIPGGGTLTLPGVIPTFAGIDAETIYLLAAVLDDSFPFGLDFSNGATLNVLAPPTAGASQSTVVGRKVVFDGSSMALPDGTIEPGLTVLWTIVQAPAGSAASIANPTRPFATLAPDVAGDYLVRATVQTANSSFQTTTTVHVWDVQTTPVGDGAILPFSPIPLNGKLVGPLHASFLIDGQPAAVQPNGTFGPVNVEFGAGEIIDEKHFRIAHADGTVASVRKTFFKGTATNLAAPSVKTLSAQLNDAALDMVAAEGEAVLEAADIKSVLLALPPQQVANEEGPFGFTIFSATIDFDDLKYAANMVLDLDATAAGIVGSVTIFNIKATFSVYGEVLEIGYDLDGDITTSPTVIHAKLVGSSQNGQLAVAVDDVVVDRQNFNFNLNGFIGSVAELFVIESSVKAQVEATIASTVQAELGPAIADILNGFVLQGSLMSTLDVDLNLAAPITGVVHANHGVTIHLDGKTTVGVPEPGSPAVTAYRGTPTLPVTFAAQTPQGVPYGAGLSIADDFINQILAAGTAAGLMDGDLTSLIPTGGAPVALATDQLAILFSDAGFDHWPVGTNVTLRAHGTVPPTFEATPGAASMGRIHMRNLEVEFEVATPYGPVPLLLVSMTGSADVNVGSGAGGMLEVSLVSSSLSLSVLRVFPGGNVVAMESQVGFLGAALDIALPQIIDALGAIPLPSLEAEGLGLQVNEIDLFGTGGQHVGLFGHLLLLP